MRLHRQLVLLLLAALLPLGLVLAVLGATTLRQGREGVEREVAGQVSVAAAEISRELQAETQVLTAMAQSPTLDGGFNEPAFHLYATRVLKEQPLWRALALLGPDGRRLMNLPQTPPSVPGRVIDEQSHRRVMATGQPVVGAIISPRGLRPAFVIFAPVIREGRVVYVLSAVVEPVALRQRLLTGRLPAGWRATVMDRAQHIVTRTFAPDATGALASPPARKALAEAATGVYRVTATDGSPFVAGYQILPASGWSVHVAIPADQYEAPIRRAAAQLAFGGLASLLVAAVFLWLLSREVRLRHQATAELEEGRRLEALGRITGGVAHDFNNLLMIVQGSAELLRRRIPAEPRAEALTSAILAAAQRGQMLTRQLLAFGRRSAHEPADFRLQDRAAALLPLLQRSTAQTISVDLRIPPETWPVHADADALEVALINLAVNARDAMPDGGRLAITAVNVSRPAGRAGAPQLEGDFVAISVADTGSGIPREHLDRVFEPFYTTKSPGRGTGLGLSQVYGFAKQSGGDVALFSRVGEGTTVTLHLPRGAEPAMVADEPRPELGPGAGRILLVEDNADVAEVTAAMLAAAGYEVTRTTDAATALQRLSLGPGFDMLLSDIVLDGTSGLELARQVRSASPGLPILLVTGYSSALAAGGAEFPILAKPFGQVELLDAVRRALRPAPEPAVGVG